MSENEPKKLPDDMVVQLESFEEESSEDPMICRDTGTLPPQPQGKLFCRVGPKKWVEVDKEGRCVVTGVIQTRWNAPPLVMKSLSRRRKPKPKKCHPKFLRKGYSVDINTKGDPAGVTWQEREPWAAYCWCRLAFLEGKANVAEMVEKTGFTDRQVKYWIYVSREKRMSWMEERRIEQNKIVQAVLKNTKDKCVETVQQLLDIVASKVGSITMDDATELTVREMKDLVAVADDLHKISQLESGKPTDIKGNVKLTREAVLEKLKAADPYVNYDEPKESGASKKSTTH